ncbi:MAG: CinA family protein [Acidaminococcaceae bacterium]|nr:CinA family protein [Acidaminococcaceae bacterium]
MTDSELIGQLLNKYKETIAFAESCTGGLAASMITDVAGSSAYMQGGIVCYTNEIKAKVLGVKEETLAKFSAISEATAKEMAENIRQKFHSDYGIGITGNAGPGASEGKPLGLVYIGIASANKTQVWELHFNSTRIENKKLIATNALSLLKEFIELEKGVQNA